jgi:hypothetical protein
MWLKKAVTREERIVVTHFGGQYMTVHLTQNLLFTDDTYFLSADTSLLQTTSIRAVLIRDRLWHAPLRSEGRCVGCHCCHTINRTHYVKRTLLRRSRKRALWASTVMTSFWKYIYFHKWIYVFITQGLIFERQDRFVSADDGDVLDAQDDGKLVRWFRRSAKVLYNCVQ